MPVSANAAEALLSATAVVPMYVVELLAALSPVLVPDTAVVPVTASVGVEEPESVTPFTDVGVMAAKPIVNAGVGDAIDQVAVTPLFAAAVDTDVTVPTST